MMLQRLITRCRARSSLFLPVKARGITSASHDVRQPTSPSPDPGLPKGSPLYGQRGNCPEGRHSVRSSRGLVNRCAKRSLAVTSPARPVTRMPAYIVASKFSGCLSGTAEPVPRCEFGCRPAFSPRRIKARHKPLRLVSNPYPECHEPVPVCGRCGSGPAPESAVGGPPHLSAGGVS
jgi:hypothetical protein